MLNANRLPRLARLKRFLAPAVAELITTRGEEPALTSHRGYISTLFSDLRGFTAFSESTEPEEVIGVLQSYHEAMGRLVVRYEATIDHLAARLCDQTADGEILITHKAYMEVENDIHAEPAGELEVKGFGQPVKAYKVAGLV